MLQQCKIYFRMINSSVDYLNGALYTNALVINIHLKLQFLLLDLKGKSVLQNMVV